jgi:methylated-DNA-protein-cysteine methyltransferase-like protein
MKNNGLNKPAKEGSSLEEPSLVQPSREEKVFMVLAAVPSGSVVTYGQLADLAGLPRAARMVGRILGNLPKDTELPWHRVINAAGKISLAEDSQSVEVQKARLQEEGIVFNNNRVSLKKFNWQP